MLVCSGLGSGRRLINLQEFRKVSMTCDPGISGGDFRKLVITRNLVLFIPSYLVEFLGKQLQIGDECRSGFFVHFEKVFFCQAFERFLEFQVLIFLAPV